jgi:putative transposase
VLVAIPHPSPGDWKPARTLAVKADGTDVLLGNVEFQHRHAAQLNTHANGIAERWVGSCRGDLLDHIVAVNERHLKRLLAEHVRYHHEDRTHLGLEKGTPGGRIRSVASGRVLYQERLGGLHHRYDRAA